MRKLICSIQQGQVPRDRISAIETTLKRSYAEHLGPDPAAFVIWCEVPRGQAYTEGRLSDTCWLMIEVADGLDQALRERAMLALAADFARAAGVHVDKLMVTLCDSTLFGEYLAANRARLRPLARIAYTLKMLVGLVRSRRRDGYASIAVNY
jgi:hypothetical protein